MPDITHLNGIALVKKKGNTLYVVSDPEGVADESPIIAEGTTTPRMLTERFADIVNVRDFGAKPSDSVDDSEAFFAAAEKGKIFVPNGDYLVTVDSDDDLAKAIQAIDGATLQGKLTIKIEGHRKSSVPFVVNCKGGENLHVVGDWTDVTITAIGSVSGTTGAYSVPITLSSAEGVSVGDVLVIRGDNCTVGTGSHEVLRGAWRITAVSGNVVTVTNTCWLPSFPTFTLTSGFGFVLHSVVTFENCDGVVVMGATLGELDKVAIAGNASDYWLSSNVEGTEKGTHGVYVGGPTIVLNGKQDNANESGITNACASLGRYTAVLDFDQQGIVCTKGASIYARFVTSSSNRRRGWYAELNGSIWCKNSIATGNYLDGYISDVGGAIGCNISTAAGNGGIGFSCITNGIMQNSTCTAASNVGDGFYVIGSGVMYCATSVAKDNEIGFHASYNGALLGNGSSASGNRNDGFRAELCSGMRTPNCSSTNNGRYGFYASTGGVINAGTTVTVSGNASGDIYSSSLGVVSTGSGSAVYRIPYETDISGTLSVSSSQFKITRSGVETITAYLSTIGDFSISDSTGEIIVWKAGKISMHPGNDNAMTLGRQANRWSVVYAGTGTINTSDYRCKQNIANPTQALLKAWGNVGFKVFQFKDAVEKKGESSARYHVGVIAQDVQMAFTEQGLDASKYGLFCHDSWEDEYETIEVVDQPEVLNEAGEVVTPAVVHTEQRKVLDAGDRYGVRYEEALALECAYLRDRLSKIETVLASHGITLGDE